MRWLCAACLAAAIASPASAQRQRFDVQQFAPPMTQRSSTIGLYQGRTLRRENFDVGLVLDWADGPLVLRNDDGDRISEIVSGQLTGHIVGGFGLYDVAEVLLDIPVILHQTGDAFGRLPNLDSDASGAGLGIGDLRVGAKVRILQNDDPGPHAGVALSLAAEVQFPTGERFYYQGGDFRFTPTAAFDVYGKRGHRLTLNVGYTVRPSATLFDAEVDDTLNYGVAVDFLATSWMEIIAEIRGKISILADDIGSAETPLEAALGIRMRTDFASVMLSGGVGLIEGFGTPDYRIGLAASYFISWEPLRFDYDNDGFYGDGDQCPHQPEDRDGYQDDDGCPDGDPPETPETPRTETPRTETPRTETPRTETPRTE
ncbi:MAG: transporter, partial [Myxococcota bacterium]